MKKYPVTKRMQERVLEAIHKHGLPPSVEDLARVSGYSYRYLRKVKGGVRTICQDCGVDYDSLPDYASQFERSVYSLLRNFLDSSEIRFQHRFPGCRRMVALPFDFYIPSINLVVEADGTQHYGKSPPHWGPIRNTDGIKNEYCRDNDIGILRIRYKRFKWQGYKIKQELEKILLHARETGRANCFNCWDGDESFPISIQATDKKQPESNTVDIKCCDKEGYTEVTRLENDVVVFTIKIDTRDLTKLGHHTVYEKQGKVYHNGKSLSRKILGIPGTNKTTYVRHENGDAFDMRRSNLCTYENAEMKRSRRVTYRSKTGVAGIHKCSGVTKGKRYHYVTAHTQGVLIKKSFAYIQHGSEQAALKAAKTWLKSVEGSTTRSKDRTPKPVETGSSLPCDDEGDDMVCSARNT